MDVNEEDCIKTAFVSHHGHYRLTRVPLGLKDAPETFQRVEDVILTTMKWQVALVYLEDIVIFSKTAKGYSKDVRQVLTLGKDAGVTVKLRK